MSAAAPLALPARLDLPAAAPLAAALLARRGAALRLDASACRSIGTPGLQVLLSAAATWRAAGEALVITGFTEDCLSQLAQFGLGRRICAAPPRRARRARHEPFGARGG